MTGRGSIKSLDFSIVISATTDVLNSLPKNKDHLAELVYLLIAKEYERVERNYRSHPTSRRHHNEYPVKRFASLITKTRLKSLGWRRLQASVLTDVMHKGKLISTRKNHFRYIGDDE